MRGLTDKCLVYLMTLDEYLSKQEQFMSMYKNAVTNLFKYLNSVGIRPHVQITEETAYVMGLDESLFSYVHDMLVPDFIFMCRENDVFNHIRNSELVKYPDIYKRIMKRYPTLRDVDEETRFNQVLDRSKRVLKEIEKEYMLFVHTGAKKKKDKEKDGTFHLYIDTRSLLLQASVSNTEVDVDELLQVNYAHKYINDWEVN